MSKTYVIDIDGTICNNGSCESCKYEGSIPIEHRIAYINKLYDDGNIIKYFTARGMGRYNDDAEKAKEKFYTLTKMQLNIWGCKYHQLILGKPSGDFYIDDKAITDHDFFN
jgi:phosphatidate phosphatase PAH1